MFFWSFSRGHLISQFDQLLTSPVSPQPPVQRAHHVRQVGWFSNHISGTFITWSGTTHQNRWWSDWIFPHWNPMKLYQTLWNLIEIQQNCTKAWNVNLLFHCWSHHTFWASSELSSGLPAFSCVPFQNGLQHPGVFAQPQRIRPLRWFKKNMKYQWNIQSRWKQVTGLHYLRSSFNGERWGKPMFLPQSQMHPPMHSHQPDFSFPLHFIKVTHP